MNFKQTFAIIAATLSTTLVVLPARAQFTVNQNKNKNDLIKVLLGDTPGLSKFKTTITGAPQAFGVFSKSPFGFDNGLVLSSGNVTEIPGVNSIDGGTTPAGEADLNTPFNTPGDVSGSFDLARLEFTFDADATAEKVFFEYVFGSEEFKEFGGSAFNDSFDLLLNGVNIAKLTNGKEATVNNLVPNPNGSYNADFIANPAGPGTETKLDGYTKSLTFEGALIPGETNTIQINVRDTADALLDSAVFLKGGSLTTDPDPVDPDPVDPDPVDPDPVDPDPVDPDPVDPDPVDPDPVDPDPVDPDPVDPDPVDPEPIPEPMTILGTGFVLASLPALKKASKKAKKQ